MDTSIGATADRLRRVYACVSNDAVCAVYGVRKWDAAAWHREQDERSLARAYLSERSETVAPVVSPPRNLAAIIDWIGTVDVDQWPTYRAARLAASLMEECRTVRPA